MSTTTTQPLPQGIFDLLQVLREFATIRDAEGLNAASEQWQRRFSSEMRDDLEIFDCIVDEAWPLAKELLRARETEGR